MVGIPDFYHGHWLGHMRVYKPFLEGVFSHIRFISHGNHVLHGHQQLVEFGAAVVS